MQGKWIRKPPQGEASAVFVHGILSSGETCWRNDNGCEWPELLKNERKLAPLGIYVFTYQTGIFSGSYRIGDIVDALKELMRLDGVLECNPLIFVCHSMGGIVVRKYIVERQADLIGAGKQIDLFLVASPSLGAIYADWLSPLAQFLGHAQADALRFVRDNYWLMDLDKEFLNLKEGGRLKIKGKELVEDKFVVLEKLLRRQVVEPFSGARYFGESVKVPGSDHFSIAKPDSIGALQHRLLREFIKEAISPGSELWNGARENHSVGVPSDRPPWPNETTPFDHGLADRTEWRDIQELMTATSAIRILMLKGDSGHSKTALLDAAFHYASETLRVPTAYVQYTDTQLLGRTEVLKRLQLDLGAVLPDFAAAKEPDRWALLEDLRKSRTPILILLDAYDKIKDSKELVDWIETELLAEAKQCAQLRFLIAGQNRFERVNARWRDLVKIVELKKIDKQQDWKEWTKKMNLGVDDKHIEALVLTLEGVPSTISESLTRLAMRLAETLPRAG